MTMKVWVVNRTSFERGAEEVYQSTRVEAVFTSEAAAVTAVKNWSDRWSELEVEGPFDVRDE